MIKVELTNEDGELFKKFRRYQDDFQFLLNGKLFDFKNGEAVIYRDENGVLKDIRVNAITNKRKKLDKHFG